LTLCGITTYLSQMSIYRKQCQRDITNVASYLASLAAAEGEDFIRYKDFYEAHYDKVDIPVDASEYLSYKEEFESLFAKRYPGKTFNKDISFEELDEDVQKAWFIYYHLYWLLTYEQARADFNLPYTYFLIPNDVDHTNVYMIDGERNSRADHIAFVEENPQYKPFDHYQGDEDEYMYLNDEYSNPLEEHQVLWKTWETGEEQDGYKVWHNLWGDTYSYYAPVWIDHQKIGLTVAEVDIRDVNSDIMKNTISQLGLVFTVLLITLGSVMLYIRSVVILRVERLETNVKQYTTSKDSGVVKDIEKNIKGHDEITSLSEQFISMIIEIENYLKNLVKVNKALDEEKGNSVRLADMAFKDSLTGIRNRNAYENEVRKLEWDFKDGNTDFGFAVFDLDNLKTINDKYGHEQGNCAIRKLCETVCQVFMHSPVFRTGGDEFVAILRGHDHSNIDELIKEFNEQLETLQQDDTLEPWEKIRATVGTALYDADKDIGVDEVFKRAEHIMYESKKR
ncbi:MAG: GGDEF domain-containing protein, partial [Lachnospiraceae bacterium]|nr:GGDEF domain-containing protein [Lachnospiraceae bacterium]